MFLTPRLKCSDGDSLRRRILGNSTPERKRDRSMLGPHGHDGQEPRRQKTQDRQVIETGQVDCSHTQGCRLQSKPRPELKSLSVATCISILSPRRVLTAGHDQQHLMTFTRMVMRCSTRPWGSWKKNFLTEYRSSTEIHM